MEFAWVAGTVCSARVAIPTISVVNGVCHSGTLFLSPTGRKAYWIWDFLSFYVTDLFLFIYCYGRILVVIRRQARVVAAHSGQASNTAQDQSNKIQIRVIKTMTVVSVLFAVTWPPVYIHVIPVTFDKASIDENVLYIVMSIAYVYICTNQFVYAIKFQPVKRVLFCLIPCKKYAQRLQSGINT